MLKNKPIYKLMDGKGRVLIPKSLRDAAKLESFYRILMTETGETSEETIVEKGDTGHDRTGN